MRKTGLLLASIALAVLLACGVALAAEIQCPNRTGGTGTVCIGTPQRDIMTGTNSLNPADVIYGRGGNDLITALAGNDRISGGLGNDRLRGGGDRDRYLFRDDDWGKDTIVDTTPDVGGNSLQFDLANSRPQQALTIHLASSPDRPEVVNESGEGRVNWSGNAITSVFIDGSANDDTITGNPAPNTILSHTGTDTVTTGAGNDHIRVRDGVGDDVVNCGEDGPGITDNDTVYADTGDTLTDCEWVNP